MPDERFTDHIERLVADAEREAKVADWKAARALAEAALTLRADEPRARAILRSAHNALSRVGERRQLTILFSDVVGSTELTSQIDPEVVRDILRSYQATCADTVLRYDGHVASYLGDGIVAYFGYPQIHEDDPERAVRCGLDVLDALTELTASVRDRLELPFNVRVAVHTGLVVRAEMGGPGRRDVDAVVGATPNVAARLQEHAKPGTLIISSDTYDLVKGNFAVRALGPLVLRGVSAAVEAYEVLGESTSEAPSATPFCNRTTELTQLEAAWATVQDGFKMFVVTGDPGMGKSRLAEEFTTRVEREGGATVRCACSAFHTASALYPARRMVEAACQVDSRDDPERTLPRLRDTLAGIGKEHLVGVFADMLGIPPDAGWEPPQLEGPQLRELTLSTMVDWIATAAADGPLLVVIDDLHWADPSTLELIGRTVRRHIPGLMLIVTAREFVSPWPEGAAVALTPLPESHLRQMVAGLPEAKALSPDAVANAVRRSEGVPFFLEELVRAADNEPLDVTIDADSIIPAALVSPLLARLGAPGVDLGLCQAVATVGREVDHDVLAALVGVPDDVLDARLQVLVDARILEPTPGEHRVYRYRHDLLRELAYETQLRQDRRRLHSAIADILDALDVHGIPGDAGAIGYHLEHAGRISGAVDAYTRTARDLLAHGAFAEGVEHLERCLKLIEELTDERERQRLELSARQQLGLAWVSAYGYSSTQAVEEFRRCVELCEQLGPDAAVPSIEAIWYYYTLRGELDRADEIIVKDRRRLDLGPNALPEEGARCAIRFFRGDFAGAINDMESFLDSPYAKGATDAAMPWPLPDDPVVNTWTFLAMARWWTADPVGSREAFDRALARAALLPYPHGPFGLAYVRNIQILNARIAGLDDEADELIGELETIADRHGFAFFSMAVTTQRMISGVRRGRPATDLQGLVAMSQMLGIEVWTGSMAIEEGWNLTRDAEWDAARERADMVLATSAGNGVHFLDAEAHRLRATARLGAGDGRGVDDLDAAVDVARTQGATVWELRALLDRAAQPGGEHAAGSLKNLLAELDADGLPEVEEAVRLGYGRAAR